MKRIIAMALLLALCLPLLFGCASSLDAGLTETAAEEEGKKEEKKESTESWSKDQLPDGFAVGYAAGDITGSTPIEYFGGTAKGVHDPLLLTCIAVSDGEEVALIMTADLKKMLDNVSNKSLEIIEKKFGIPAENVILSCTHTHSAPDAGATSAGNSQWMQQYYKKLPTIVEEALLDLDVVEGAYTGKANTEHPIGYVRRYYLANGKVKMNPSVYDNPVAYESEADPEFRTVRFDRKNKKDVLLVNFQTHYGGATSLYPEMLSADFVDPFRDRAEKEFDCLFAYYSGASGDINFQNALGPRYYQDMPASIDGFMETTEACLRNEKKAAVGDIKASRSLYACTVRHDSEERVAQAKEVAAAGYETDAGKALMLKYGFESNYDASFVVVRSSLPETLDVPVNAISFGDFGFVGAPYEMFHVNGKQIRDGSPYETTFVCSLSLGAFGYIPSALGYQNGGYETFNCRFVGGTGELLAQEMVRLLNENKNAG